MMKQFTCVVCPNSCEITVENVNGDLHVTGEGCARGRAWALQETTDPRRTIATSVRVLGGAEPLCSVRLTRPIPRGEIMRAVETIHALELHAPVKAGSVLISDILGTGSDVIATRGVAKAPREQIYQGPEGGITMDPFAIIRQDGLLPKVTIKKAEEIPPLLDAVCKGGIRALEMAPDTTCVLEALRAAHAHPGTVTGAGAVPTQAMADALMEAGAAFLTVTGQDLSLLEHCLEKGYPVIPVCSSFSEASAAYAKGCRVLKLTPSARPEGLIDILKMSGQLPDASFIPDEGIAPEDLGPWLEEECVAACSGSFIIDSVDIDSGRFSDITRQCEQAVKRVLGFELAHIGINNTDRAEAGERAKQVADLFRLPVRPGANSTYAGDALEFMHAGVYGTVGHLGFCTGSAERAMAFFRKRGIDIIGESIRRDEKGRVWFFYLREELFGFALHVMNRKRP